MKEKEFRGRVLGEGIRRWGMGGIFDLGNIWDNYNKFWRGIKGIVGELF